MSLLKSNFIIALFLIFSAGCSVSQINDLSANKISAVKDKSRVDSAIESAVEEGAFPFLYVVVEKLDGTVVYEHSAVNSQFTDRVPTGKSWMRLWSMSKSVTIAMILRLEEEGILNRHDLLTDYIPEFSTLQVLDSSGQNPSCDNDLKPLSRPITIEDLLNHNDGFYYPFTEFDCLNTAFRQLNITQSVSSKDLVNKIATLPLHPDGVGAHIYGIGTTILGLVAERATGIKFSEIVEENLTRPLGISETLRFTLPEGVLTYPRVTGRDGKLRFAEESELDILGESVPSYQPNTEIFLGGEGMVGTSKSYAKFLRMMANLGELDGTRVLQESTVRDWYAPKTQLDSPYGHNGFNIWVTSGQFDGLPNQKPGLLVGGGYEGTSFWIDLEAGYVGLIMSQVHEPATSEVDAISKIRGMLYKHFLEPEVSYP